MPQKRPPPPAKRRAPRRLEGKQQPIMGSRRQEEPQEPPWEVAKRRAKWAAGLTVAGLTWQGGLTVKENIEDFFSPDKKPSVTTEITPPIPKGTTASVKSAAGTFEFTMGGKSKNKVEVKLSLVDAKYGAMNEAIDASNIICVKTNKKNYQVIVDFRAPEQISFINHINQRRDVKKVKQLNIPCGDKGTAKKVESLLVALQRYGEAANTAPTPEINYKVIARLEGGQQLKAYVPNNNGKVIGKSGVTVATGVDLGQHSEDDMKKWDIPKTLLKKILPYAGKKKAKALEHLRENPLTITKEEAEALDKVMHTNILAGLVARYDSDTKGPRFGEIPPEAQTVLLSATYNMGDLSIVAPKMWKMATEQNWDQMAKELQNWDSSSKGIKNRRRAEGEYLEAALVSLKKQAARQASAPLVPTT